MITKITATNWKSFEKLEYKLQSLNILLGNNSSGKSNFLDLLEFISKVARGASYEELNKIRGGIDYFKKIDKDKFHIIIEIEDESKNTIENYIINENNFFRIVTDSLKNKSLKKEFDIEKLEVDKTLYILKDITNRISTNNWESINKELRNYEYLIENNINKMTQIKEHMEILLKQIKNITVLDPTPSLIRGTTKHENRELLKDCSNLISFVAGMEDKEKINIENKLVEYLKKLTFSEIQSVSFKFLGENKEFAQLYIEENGIKLHSDIISDGMLRFISIIVALITQKTGGILAIEEIDNGIAPYQLKMLMDIVDEISAERQFDVVFTTHNHLLINYLGEEYMDFVFYVSKKDGKSNIKRIKDYPQYGKLSSYGKLGDLVDNEEVINILNAQGDVDEA